MPRRGVIDDDIGLSANICLEIAQQTRHLSRGYGGRLLAVGDTVERDQRFAGEIEGPSDLAVPQTPANPIDDFNEIRTRLAIARGDVRPAVGRLINMLNPHRKVESVKLMMSWAWTGRFAERARTFRPIAENRDRTDGCRAQFMKNAAQLILLGNSLCGHAAENELLPVVICDLGERDLERAHLIMTNRPDMASIDGKFDRFRPHAPTPIARGRDGRFVPAGICWVVERPFAWLSRYRRLNTIFERSKDLLVAFVAIAFISILARRLKRIVPEDFSA